MATPKEMLRYLMKNNNRSYLVLLENFWTHGNDERATVYNKFGCTYQQWEELYKLYKRHGQFKHYIKETSQEWKKIDEIHWADNSIEEIQENKYGERRKVMVKAPSGDACY